MDDVSVTLLLGNVNRSLALLVLEMHVCFGTTEEQLHDLQVAVLRSY